MMLTPADNVFVEICTVWKQLDKTSLPTPMLFHLATLGAIWSALFADTCSTTTKTDNSLTEKSDANQIFTFLFQNLFIAVGDTDMVDTFLRPAVIYNIFRFFGLQHKYPVYTFACRPLLGARKKHFRSRHSVYDFWNDARNWL